MFNNANWLPGREAGGNAPRNCPAGIDKNAKVAIKPPPGLCTAGQPKPRNDAAELLAARTACAGESHGFGPDATRSQYGLIHKVLPCAACSALYALWTKLCRHGQQGTQRVIPSSARQDLVEIHMLNES